MKYAEKYDGEFVDDLVLTGRTIQTLTYPDCKWKLEPVEGWIFQLENRPNAWNRFWYKVIFGWKFKKI